MPTRILIILLAAMAAAGSGCRCWPYIFPGQGSPWRQIEQPSYDPLLRELQAPPNADFLYFKGVGLSGNAAISRDMAKADALSKLDVAVFKQVGVQQRPEYVEFVHARIGANGFYAIDQQDYTVHLLYQWNNCEKRIQRVIKFQHEVLYQYSKADFRRVSTELFNHLKN